MFATVVAVLLDGSLLLPASERSLGGPQPGFWEQSPDAPGLAALAPVEPLLLLWASLNWELPSSEQPLRALRSAVLACLPWRSPD